MGARLSLHVSRPVLPDTGLLDIPFVRHVMKIVSECCCAVSTGVFSGTLSDGIVSLSESGRCFRDACESLIEFLLLFGNDDAVCTSFV